MEEELYKIFTHTSVLQSREPEYFVCQDLIDLDVDLAAGRKCQKTEESRNVVKTKENDDITEEIIKPLTNEDAFFSINCELYNNHTTGHGRTKKIAKQMAAKEMLLKLVEKELFKEFGLGQTKEEAIASLENLMEDFQKREVGDKCAVENWIGQVNERCQRLKLPNPTYEITEETSATQRDFIATCSVGVTTVEARGKTKKIAKSLAAKLMFLRMEEDADLTDNSNTLDVSGSKTANEDGGEEATIHENSESLFDVFLENIEHPESLEKVHSTFRNGSLTQKLVKSLNDLINSGDDNINKIFRPETMKFSFLNPDGSGVKLCLLSIAGTDDNNVFHGHGKTETEAKECAARNAFVYLEQLLRTSEQS
ncbi:unnamed protein product [Thelazia callipaeda]|uniref:DRBM domain-containing protein n=1 Tax=Thelazia callipaeda TaxID=103827 RepID=A0A0N5D5M3_THECL|nr:unnamed protein product [Thelazia callipaeda]